jgi:hypothetical protein
MPAAKHSSLSRLTVQPPERIIIYRETGYHARPRVRTAEVSGRFNDIERLLIDCIGLFGTKNMFGFANDGWKPWTTFDGTDVLVPGLFNTEPDENGDIPMFAEGDANWPPAA